MESISVERDGAVVRIRLTRADRHNAQIPAMWHDLRETGCELMAEGGIGCVVVSGSGSSFSSGMDLKEAAKGGFGGGALSARDGGRGRQEWLDGDLATMQEAFRWLTEAPFVTIAAVHGHAIGAGAELALACDLRIFADDVQFSLPEVELGMMPDMGGCDRLPRIVGYPRALELMLTCRRIGAREALELGIAASVVSTEELDEASSALAATIAGRPLQGVHFTKRATAAGAAGERDKSFALARKGALALTAQRASAVFDVR